jgi:hypothetical protein
MILIIEKIKLQLHEKFIKLCNIIHSILMSKLRFWSNFSKLNIDLQAKVRTFYLIQLYQYFICFI